MSLFVNAELAMWRFGFVILLACGRAEVVHGVDPPEDFLKRLNESLGANVITSGEFRYQLTVDLDALSPQQIKMKVDRGLKDLEKMLEETEDEGLRKAIQNSREFLVKEGPAKIAGNSHRVLDYYFSLESSSLGGDRFVEFSRVPLEDAADVQYLLQRVYGDGRCTAVRAIGGHQGFVDSKFFYPGCQEPHTLGRFVAESWRELLISAEGKEVWDVKEVSNGIFQVKGERTAQDLYASRIELQVDTTRGYITPVIEEFDSHERLLRKFTSAEYFHPAGSELWFPAVTEYEQNVYRHGENQKAEVRRERYQFDTKSVVVNVPIAKSRFKVDLNFGARIIESNGDSVKEYYCAAPTRISIDDAKHLEAAKGVRILGVDRVKVLDVQPYEPKTGSQGRGFVFYFTLLVMSGLILRLYFRWRNQRAAILVICLSYSFVGCSAEALDTGSDSKPSVFASPGSLQLGMIAADGRDYLTKFRVCNDLAQDVMIQIYPSCNCTAVDRGAFTLQKNSGQDVEIAIKTIGQKGTFESDVRIVVIDPKGMHQLSEINLPIAGSVRQSWSVQPSRVFCNRTSSEEYVGYVTITGPLADWGKIVVGSSNSSYKVIEESRTGRGDAQLRGYRIVGDARVTDPNLSILLSLDSQSAPFMRVPIMQDGI